jgi:hypothetical protein
MECSLPIFMPDAELLQLQNLPTYSLDYYIGIDSPVQKLRLPFSVMPNILSNESEI